MAVEKTIILRPCVTWAVPASLAVLIGLSISIVSVSAQSVEAQNTASATTVTSPSTSVAPLDATNPVGPATSPSSPIPSSQAAPSPTSAATPSSTTAPSSTAAMASTHPPASPKGPATTRNAVSTRSSAKGHSATAKPVAKPPASLLGAAEQPKSDARTGLVDTSLFGNFAGQPEQKHVDAHSTTPAHTTEALNSIKPNAAALNGIFPIVRDAKGFVKEPTPAEIPPVVSDTSNSIKNFHVVSPGLFRGAQPDTAGFQALKRAGVTTVVNLRNEPAEVQQEKELTEKLGMKYLDIPMAVFDPITDKQVNEFLSTVDKAKGPVYVHCQFGQDRTGTMCAMYRMHAMGWSGDQAIPEMLKFGFKPELLNYMNAVVQYSQKLGRPATPPDADFMLKDVKLRIGKVLNKNKKK